MPFPNLNGRPVEYTEDIPDKVFEYIAECEKEEVPPTKAGFGCYINVVKSTLQRWEKRYPQLKAALEKLSYYQENDVLKYSLKGEYNSTIAKLILTNNHGYSDKVQTENTNVNVDIDDDNKPVEEKLQDVLQRIKELKE